MSVAIEAKYREQYVKLFERRTSVLRPAVTTDSENRGGSTYFLVAGSSGEATTRGPNGQIPPSDDSQTQVQVSFNEDTYLNEKTNFDIFRAQGDQLAIMRENCAATLYRKMDKRIITAAETGTVSLGSVSVMTKTVANRIVTILRNADVGIDDMGPEGEVFVVLSPTAYTYMTDITSFANSDYTKFTGKVDEGIPIMGKWRSWMGVNWGEHGGLTGKGTSSCTCLAWHRAAIGHVINKDTVAGEIGYDRKQQTSWVSGSVYDGAAKLQNAGIVKFTHDDSGISA